MQKSFEERALFSETNILFKVINYKNVIYNFHSSENSFNDIPGILL